MSLACEGIRRRFAQARQRADQDHKLLYQGQLYRGTALVLLSIRHDGACDYETTYPLYLPLIDEEVLPTTTCPYWDALLATRLHMGVQLSGDIDLSWRKQLQDIRSHNPGALADVWDWDWDDPRVFDEATSTSPFRR